jgi:tetratricopeptide (TPR) repeat protein
MIRLLLLALLLAPAALAQAPADPLAQARVLIADGEAQAALDLLAGDTTRTAAYLRGLALSDQARFPDASQAFSQADTSSRRVQMAWARSLESGGRADEARGLLARAYAQDTTHTATALAYGRHLAGSRHWADADTVYSRLVRADSANAYLRARLAYVHLQQERTDDAIVGYEIALQLDPSDRSSLLALTRIYLDTGAPISAKRVWDRFINRHFDDPSVWRRGGEIEIDLEDFGLAVQHVRSAVALGDTTGPTLRMLGAAHYLDGDYIGADSVLTRAVYEQADDWLTTYYLGLTRLALEQYGTARGWLIRTTELLEQATLAEVHGYLGQIAGVEERWSDGIASYRLARQLDPDRAAFRYRLATLYDAYYADRQLVREAYESFVASADSSALPDEFVHAQERIRQLREQAHMRGQ